MRRNVDGRNQFIRVQSSSGFVIWASDEEEADDDELLPLRHLISTPLQGFGSKPVRFRHSATSSTISSQVSVQVLVVVPARLAGDREQASCSSRTGSFTGSAARCCGGTKAAG